MKHKIYAVNSEYYHSSYNVEELKDWNDVNVGDKVYINTLYDAYKMMRARGILKLDIITRNGEKVVFGSQISFTNELNPNCHINKLALDIQQEAFKERTLHVTIENMHDEDANGVMLFMVAEKIDTRVKD